MRTKGARLGRLEIGTGATRAQLAWGADTAKVAERLDAGLATTRRMHAAMAALEETGGVQPIPGQAA